MRAGGVGCGVVWWGVFYNTCKGGSSRVQYGKYEHIILISTLHPFIVHQCAASTHMKSQDDSRLAGHRLHVHLYF